MAARKPLILLAARKLAREPFLEALVDDASFVDAETLEQAVRMLKADPEIDLVCCTVYFDESRMFDLVRWMRSYRKETPVVCARALPKDLPHISLEAVSIASKSLGASFIDYPELVRQKGAQDASRDLRSAVLGRLP